MRDIWIRAVKGITWPINNSTSRKATRRVRRKPKSSRPVRGVDRLVRLLSFASAFKSCALKVLLLSGYLTIFHCDVIIKVSVKVSFPHFGKAGWDCVTEGNINFLLCASVVLSKFHSRREWPQRYNSQNLHGGILFSLSVFWNSVSLLLNVERDEFVRSRRRAYARWMTRKKVRVLEGLPLFVMRLIYNTVIARNRINSFDSLFFRESDLRDRIKRINKLFISLR